LPYICILHCELGFVKDRTGFQVLKSEKYLRFWVVVHSYWISPTQIAVRSPQLAVFAGANRLAKVSNAPRVDPTVNLNKTFRLAHKLYLESLTRAESFLHFEKQTSLDIHRASSWMYAFIYNSAFFRGSATRGTFRCGNTLRAGSPHYIQRSSPYAPSGGGISATGLFP
jgi:hypothetical protein